MNTETWKPIKNYPEYQVSDFGNVKSKMNQLMKPRKDKDGYLLIDLYKNGIMKNMRIHRLVAETFELPKRKDQKTVDHIDGDRSNNNLSNLRYANQSEQAFNRYTWKNNTSGFKGVDFDQHTNKYRSRIQIDGKRQSLGYFQTAQQASDAYQAKAMELHGDFYRPIINNNCNVTINNN